MRDWLILAVAFGPAIALFAIEQGSGEPPAWSWVLAGGWFTIVLIIVGWYQGWLKRLLGAMLVLVPFGVTLAWLDGGEGTPEWPTWLNLLLITGPIAIFVVIGTWMGWFSQAVDSIKLMFARHPPACEKCLSPRKDLVWFEMPAGTTAGRARRSLCPNCVWNEMEAHLVGLNTRLLVAEPVRDANGYYSLNTKGIAEWWGVEDDRSANEATTQRVLSAVGRIVGQLSGRCEECGDFEANIYWVPAEAFRSSWDGFSDLLGYKPDKLLNDESPRRLCGGCAARSAREAAQSNRVRLHLVSPPGLDTLVILPGEA